VDILKFGKFSVKFGKFSGFTVRWVLGDEDQKAVLSS